MPRRVDFTIHLEVGDEEPRSPPTIESMNEWLIPDLLRAVRGVIGYPGDYGAVYVGYDKPNYSVTIVEEG